MELGYVILYVPSVPEAISFYESAFSQKRKFIVPSEDYGELAGPFPLAFANHEQAQSSTGIDFGASPGPPVQSKPFEVAFVTKDIHAAVATALHAGASLVKHVEDKPWGQQVAYVRDLNGFLVEICTKVTAPTAGPSL